MSLAHLGLLIVFVLLGNGLRSVVSSSVFVSEGQFASFLKISVTQTSAVIELLLGAVLLSLLVAPRLLARGQPQHLAVAMILLSGSAALGLAALFYISPGVDLREAVILVVFPLLGFGLACLAPQAQLMTGWGGATHKDMLTGIWAAAMPAAFLVTPQLVRIIAPRYGLDGFFLVFAVITFALIPVVLMLRPPENTAPQDAAQASPFPLAPAIAALLAFELMTGLVTLQGIVSPWTWGAAALFLVALAYLWLHMPKRDGQAPRAAASGGAVLILAYLFFVNMATTGFYDTSYLVDHLCSSTLVANRATLGAAAQVAAAAITSALLARYTWSTPMILVGAVFTAAGLGAYLLYFTMPFDWVYIGSKVVNGFGMGILATAAIFAVSKGAGGAGLALFTAFIIIIGTEVGLEIFEIFVQVMQLWQVHDDTTYSVIFLAQLGLVALAAPLVVLAHRKNIAPV